MMYKNKERPKVTEKEWGREECSWLLPSYRKISISSSSNDCCRWNGMLVGCNWFHSHGIWGCTSKHHKSKRYFILMGFHLEVSETALVSYIKCLSLETAPCMLKATIVLVTQCLDRLLGASGFNYWFASLSNIRWHSWEDRICHTRLTQPSARRALSYNFQPNY